MLYIILLVGFAWLLQSLLGFFQVRHFNQKYAQLRAKGRVAIGKKTALFKAGTVVLLAIDRQNNIVEAAKMQGVTIFSRVRPLKGFEGSNLLKLGEKELGKVDKLTRHAIEDAVNSYHVIANGGTLQVKRGLLERLIPNNIKR